MKMMIWSLNLKREIIKMSVHVPNSQDICSCSACGKQQERYLFVIENDKYVCVHCWLSNANKYIANESTEKRVNEQYNKFFSSGSNKY